MLSIVIVHFNTPILLRQCLSSIFSESADIPFEVIVIDNASPDTTIQQIAGEFPNARFQFNQVNDGFAAACNQAMKLGTGCYFFILNPDTIIQPGDLKKLEQFMATHPDAGVCGPRLVYPNGDLQLSCRRFPTKLALALRIFRLDRLIPKPGRFYLMADWDHASVREVDWVIGGCMLLRREAVEAVGFLDDGFFMYYEDIDLCYRLKQKGWKVYYNPDISVVHHHQRMSAKLIPNRLSYVHVKSLFRLLQKHPFRWY